MAVPTPVPAPVPLPELDGPAPAAPPRATAAPLVTYLLIAVSALVLLTGPSFGLNPHWGTGQDRVCAEQRFEQRWGAVPVELLAHRPLDALQLAAVPPAAGCTLTPSPGKVPVLSVLTSLFVHAGWLHLLGNMLFLYVFGPAVEQRLGRLRFLLFYVGIGYLATYGYALTQADTAASVRALVGASGAIAGVLGGYLRLYPRARVTTLVPVLLFLPLRFPAWLVLGLWFLLQWWSVGSAVPGVAYVAHVIGFTAGWLAVWAAGLRPRRRTGRTAADTLAPSPHTGAEE
ncbi:rhomboid family intramembrane serine protease [Kitasatospora sp. NPDC059571]|uniref:rhomboid family intramembrane serine protease n=1 Tax=Kitasatospora sp. NPDC059571 TaxID=3346871 RepID=UPI0036BC9B92